MFLHCISTFLQKKNWSDWTRCSSLVFSVRQKPDVGTYFFTSIKLTQNCLCVEASSYRQFWQHEYHGKASRLAIYHYCRLRNITSERTFCTIGWLGSVKLITGNSFHQINWSVAKYIHTRKGCVPSNGSNCVFQMFCRDIKQNLFMPNFSTY